MMEKKQEIVSNIEKEQEITINIVSNGDVILYEFKVGTVVTVFTLLAIAYNGLLVIFTPLSCAIT